MLKYIKYDLIHIGGSMAIIVKNIMEDIVDTWLESCMDKADMCKCEQCCADVKALALNRTKPRYVSRSQGNNR